MKLISIVVPTYKEERGIREFYRRTKAVLDSLAAEFEHELIFVNDASPDNTYEILLQIADEDKFVKLINFSRNFGNQAAITAGLDIAQGDIVVIIDDDLQDPPELIVRFIEKWKDGYQVVYGVRPQRKGVGYLFKMITTIYYSVLSKLSETDIPKFTGDFRLIDRSVINVLKEMREETRYFRGMIPWVGFKQIGVEYERDERYAGNSTFSIKKYFNLAITGFTAYSEKILYLSAISGLIISLISFIFLLAIVVEKIINPNFSIIGWPSMIVIILFFGGIQLLSIGIVSIYIGKIHREVKRRPLYIVSHKKNC